MKKKVNGRKTAKKKGQMHLKYVASWIEWRFKNKCLSLVWYIITSQRKANHHICFFPSRLLASEFWGIKPQQPWAKGPTPFWRDPGAGPLGKINLPFLQKNKTNKNKKQMPHLQFNKLSLISNLELTFWASVFKTQQNKLEENSYILPLVGARGTVRNYKWI
jgi:hypothetical protein